MIALELSTNSSPREAVAAVPSFLSIVESQAGAKCVVYLNYYFWRDAMGGTDAFSNNPLWLANYTAAEQPSLMPAVWSKVTFWQYSGNGTLAGIVGAVDLDRFLGAFIDLRSLVPK